MKPWSWSNLRGIVRRKYSCWSWCWAVLVGIDIAKYEGMKFNNWQQQPFPDEFPVWFSTKQFFVVVNCYLEKQKKWNNWRSILFYCIL